MSEETLTRKITGMLKRGSRRTHVMDGFHVDFRYQAKNLEDVVARMAVEAGYNIGDNIKYMITVERKSP